MALVKNGRALHFVFKIADRTSSARFYREILGMKTLRHEEFTEGCLAQCNGPYDNRWSKTMIGYGEEDNHFVLELTYNYSVDSYKFGNDFIGITIKSSEAIQRAKAANWPFTKEGGLHVIVAPGGYNFFLIDEPQPTDKDPVQKVTLASSNLTETLKYWNETLNLKIYSRDVKSAILGYGDDQAKVEFRDIGQKIDHATAFGRIAFAVPEKEQVLIDEAIKATNYTIHTPLVKLDTPGKQTVTVEILSDPDGHDICFVDEEGFSILSAFDPQADSELNKYIKKDEERKKPKAESQ